MRGNAIRAQNSPWFVGASLDVPAASRLFCFPHVGGSAASFRDWSRHLPQGVAVYGVELPGRGRRIKETPLTRLEALVGGVAEAIAPYLDRPYAFFGHSFGALLGFELARRLRRSASGPGLLCVSGAKPPPLREGAAANHTLADPQLVEVVRRMGGTPEAVLDDEGLIAALLPAIRADFEALETYRFSPGEPCDFPILAFGGAEDAQADPRALQAWGALTRAEFNLHVFPGSHFFLHQVESQLLHLLGAALTRVGLAEGPLGP